MNCQTIENRLVWTQREGTSEFVPEPTLDHTLAQFAYIKYIREKMMVVGVKLVKYVGAMEGYVALNGPISESNKPEFCDKVRSLIAAERHLEANYRDTAERIRCVGGRQ